MQVDNDFQESFNRLNCSHAIQHDDLIYLKYGRNLYFSYKK